MKPTSFRTALLASAAALVSLSATPALAAAANDAAPAASTADDQSTSANQAGQANDKQSLTTSDIIVKGSKVAENAPITASLKTTQPQAAVSREYIDNANAASDFNELVLLTPGATVSGTGNGQGLVETKLVIRGFQDGEYNVTYDSIPFADTNNPTHHSTAFFPSNTIETVVVDRGPGNASQLGQATFGGNVNLYSRAVQDKKGGQIEGLIGIWNTKIARFELQSGAVESLGGAKFVLAGQFLKSDGALTNSPVQSKNLYFKGVFPIGAHNTLTIMSTYNRNFYYQSDVLKGATCGTGGTAQAANTQLSVDNCTAASNVGKFGLDYGLGNDPTKTDFWKYNRTDKTTDFTYLRLQSDLGSHISLDNRAYMYGYTNNTFSGNSCTSDPCTVPATLGGVNVVTGFTGAGTATSPYVAVKSATDVPGYNKLNKYRVLGYIGQLDYEFKFGKLKVGGWFEHASTQRHLWNFDENTGLPSFSEKFASGTTATAIFPSTALAYAKYEQNSSWDQFQIFSELELRPIDSLTITPGVKYVHFTRGVNALVNADANRSPANNQATWTKTLPFATFNWQPITSFSVYGQYAQGMYVPDLSSFYTPSNDAVGVANQNLALAAVQPMTTTNYQLGAVWHGAKVSIDVDAYKIDVNNKIQSDTSAGAISGALVNIGMVHYKGFEGEVAYAPLAGLTVFANGSYNEARSATTGAQVAKAPFMTAALGLIYKHSGLRVSFSQKFTGPQYATEYKALTAFPDFRQYRISPYSQGEFAISQDFAERLRLGVTVSNVFNSRAITAISAGKTFGVDDQFGFLPPRSFMADARVKF